jgi:hypothetical protein
MTAAPIRAHRAGFADLWTGFSDDSVICDPNHCAFDAFPL